MGVRYLYCMWMIFVELRWLSSKDYLNAWGNMCLMCMVHFDSKNFSQELEISCNAVTFIAFPYVLFRCRNADFDTVLVPQIEIPGTKSSRYFWSKRSCSGS